MSAARVPVGVIGGFLGAGKTTLMNHLMTHADGLRLAVLVNDFGAINIDAELLARTNDGIVSLNNGCICCGIQDDLVEQLRELMNTRRGDIDAVLIEASGVADPARIGRVIGYPQLRDALRLDAVVTVVDPAQVVTLEGAAARLAREQLDGADLVVLNKTDLCSADRLRQFRESWLFSDSRSVSTCHGQVPLDLVLGAEHTAQASAHDKPFALAGSRYRPIGTAGHELDFASIVWQSRQALDVVRLRDAIRRMPSAVYRIKGFVHLAGREDEYCLLQVVGSRLELTPQSGDASVHADSRLVLIGDRTAMHEPQLRALLDACAAQCVAR